MHWKSGTAIVTGAASGLGRALALALASAGWRICLTDLDVERLAALQAEVEGRGGRGIPILLDVRDPAAWRAVHDRLRIDWPALGLLVNCAGVGATGEVGQLPGSQWQRVLDTNLLGTALGCETFLPWLR